MAALQTIRNKGAILVGVIGLGLFGFIAGDLFNALETTAAFNKQQVGEVYGKQIDIIEYQNLVEEMTEIRKLQRSMQGQSEQLTDTELEEIRNLVWSDFVRSEVIARQAEEAGIQVTDEDFQNALVVGVVHAGILQLIAAGAQGRGGGVLEQLQLLQILLSNVVQAIIEHALDAVGSAQHTGDAAALQSSLKNAVSAGIDDRSGAAGLADDGIAAQCVTV